MTPRAEVRLLRVPYDSGQRGVRMGAGPDRLAGPTAERLRREGYHVGEETIDAPPGFGAEVATAFALMRALALRVRAARDAGALPVVLAGNCNTAVGTVAGLAAGGADDDVGVLWFDAHGDLETPETTTSGFVDGTGLAALAGRCWRALAASVPGFRPVAPHRVVLVGARDLSAAERALIDETGIAWVRADALCERGPAALAPAVEALAARGVQRAYVHVDLDVHDPTLAPANHYAVPGGLTPHAVREAVQLIADRVTIAAAALTAYDPASDADGRTCGAAVELLATVAAAAAARG
ncbi:MAG TPA: arginase family protein [Gemmatimonadaceae bacterium]|nr:arginase family protein [Gemmatimonadaceae bacterium]